jgi:hypothetical protein
MPADIEAGDLVASAIILGSNNTVTIHYGSAMANPSADMGENPYKGLDAFDERSADLFFGREILTKALLSKFAAITAPASDKSGEVCRLLAVLGPSGSGKSSVARAGLIPALATSNYYWLRNPRICAFRPGARPVEELADSLAGLIRTGRQQRILAAELSKLIMVRARANVNDGLKVVAKEYLDDQSPLILLIDQFEEAYTLCKPAEDAGQRLSPETIERNAFIDAILAAIQDPESNISVILTLRSDFLGALSESPRLSRAVAATNVIIYAMDRNDLRRAITQPALDRGQRIDDATVDRILDQAAGESAILPMVQFALTRIWDGLREGLSPAACLSELGGVTGAVAGRADEILQNLSVDQQRLAERAFLGTVQLGDGFGRDTRRRARLDEITAAGETPQMIRQAIEPFIRARLLTVGAGQDDGHVWVELPHESIIRNWQTLRQWIDGQRDDLKFHRRVLEAAHHWSQADRPVGRLWRSPDLTLLQRYAERRSDTLTDLQVAFLRASQRHSRIMRWSVRAAVLTIATLGVLAAVSAINYSEVAREAELQRVAAENKKNEANARVLQLIAVKGQIRSSARHSRLGRLGRGYFCDGNPFEDDDEEGRRSAMDAHECIINHLFYDFSILQDSRECVVFGDTEGLVRSSRAGPKWSHVGRDSGACDKVTDAALSAVDAAVDRLRVALFSEGPLAVIYGEDGPVDSVTSTSPVDGAEPEMTPLSLEKEQRIVTSLERFPQITRFFDQFRKTALMIAEVKLINGVLEETFDETTSLYYLGTFRYDNGFVPLDYADRESENIEPPSKLRDVMMRLASAHGSSFMRHLQKVYGANLYKQNDKFDLLGNITKLPDQRVIVRLVFFSSRFCGTGGCSPAALTLIGRMEDAPGQFSPIRDFHTCENLAARQVNGQILLICREPSYRASVLADSGVDAFDDQYGAAETFFDHISIHLLPRNGMPRKIGEASISSIERYISDLMEYNDDDTTDSR